MRNAAIAAQKAGVKVAFTLSDSFCVARYRAEFLELVDKHVDILFANEHEILSLYEVEGFDDALQKVRAHMRDRGAHPQREGVGRCSAATRCT
jgi:sugar/nucleoside kinase (ribokinase family)